MAGSTRHDRIAKLLEVAGTSLSEQAGIRLQNKQAPLFQLIVLASLLAKPTSGDVAVAACRELIAAEMTTPAKMRRATWQRRVEVLGRAHYRRYDESTATRLGEASQLVIDRYSGDLRRPAEQSGQDRRRTVELLEEIPGIGPTGPRSFCVRSRGSGRGCGPTSMNALWPGRRSSSSRQRLHPSLDCHPTEIPPA
jgi:hypothetical protein